MRLTRQRALAHSSALPVSAPCHQGFALFVPHASSMRRSEGSREAVLLPPASPPRVFEACESRGGPWQRFELPGATEPDARFSAVYSRSSCLTPPRPKERSGTLLSALDDQQGYRHAPRGCDKQLPVLPLDGPMTAQTTSCPRRTRPSRSSQSCPPRRRRRGHTARAEPWTRSQRVHRRAQRWGTGHAGCLSSTESPAP